MIATKPNKHQMRSEVTRTALLQSATKIFVRDGFEKAQIDEIAADAGRTRGAVYAQFKTKEELFLAALEQRMNRAIEEVQRTIEDTIADPASRLRALRKYVASNFDPTWAILDLEFRLYGLRHPNAIQRLQQLYQRIYRFEVLSQLYGLREERGRSKLRSRLIALNAIGSSLLLAAQSESELTAKETRLLLEEIFDGLFPPFHDSAS